MSKTKSKEFKVAKSIFLLQDMISFIVSKIPFVLEHNLGKYFALRKAFYLTALEELEGDYYEFGVFTGSSLVCAIRTYNGLKYLNDANTTFYGFDSFSGFGEVSKEDRHGFYQNNIFSVDEKKVMDFIRKRAKKNNYKIIKGYFEKTLKGKTCKSLSKNKIRIAFIDCDMKEPARLALDFIKPGLQEGTILIMDDFLSYKGSEEKGVAGAFFGFCKQNKSISFRKAFDYGYGGVGYIVSKIK
jgi:hypothetical protein